MTIKRGTKILDRLRKADITAKNTLSLLFVEPTAMPRIIRLTSAVSELNIKNMIRHPYFSELSLAKCSLRVNSMRIRVTKVIIS